MHGSSFSCVPDRSIVHNKESSAEVKDLVLPGSPIKWRVAVNQAMLVASTSRPRCRLPWTALTLGGRGAVV